MDLPCGHMSCYMSYFSFFRSFFLLHCPGRWFTYDLWVKRRYSYYSYLSMLSGLAASSTKLSIKNFLNLSSTIVCIR